MLLREEHSWLVGLLFYENSLFWLCTEDLFYDVPLPRLHAQEYSTSVVLKPVLGTPNNGIFCMSPSFNTPDSTHQLISEVCKTLKLVWPMREIYKMCDGWGPQDRFENHCSISMILKSVPLLQSLALTLIKHLSMLIRVFKIIRKGEFDQGWS